MRHYTNPRIRSRVFVPNGACQTPGDGWINGVKVSATTVSNYSGKHIVFDRDTQDRIELKLGEGFLFLAVI